jgi:hypothetical protein
MTDAKKKPEHKPAPKPASRPAPKADTSDRRPRPDRDDDLFKDVDKPKTKWDQVKDFGKAFWHFFWHEDSILSWVANVIAAFILIKFVVYPILGLALGTHYPIVAVVSESMQHDGTFTQWWASRCMTPNGTTSQSDLYARFGVTKPAFNGFRFFNGFDKGDLMILQGADTAQVGDVLVFQAPGFSDPIIHRIIAKRSDELGNAVYDTKGDHNCGQSNFEYGITSDRVLGKAVVRIPLLGWIKIGFVKLVNILLGRA